jgi:sterol 3beta-glucosyltransferase
LFEQSPFPRGSGLPQIASPGNDAIAAETCHEMRQAPRRPVRYESIEVRPVAFRRRVARKILVAGFGSRGDVYPMLALAGRLQRRGHRVTVALPAAHRAAVKDLRVVDFASELEREAKAAVTRSVRGGVAADQVFATTIEPLLSRLAEELHPLARHHDAVIANEMLLELCTFAPQARYRLAFAIIAQPHAGLAGRLERRPVLRLVASPASFHVGAPADPAAAPIAYTGFWTGPAGRFSAPAALRRFLAGRPVAVFAMGTTTELLPPGCGRLFAEASRRAGLPAVIQDLSGADAAAADGDVLRISEIPYSWLLPRAAVVVHHAGAGTTAACVRAGRPAIALPQFGDHHYWAHRLDRLGLVAGVLDRRALNVETLARLMALAVSDLALGERCRRQAAELRTSDGLGRAVRVLERWLDPGPASAASPSLTE